jgi:hypothetical protein
MLSQVDALRLTNRLRRLMEILDKLSGDGVPTDGGSTAVLHASARALEHIARNEIVQGCVTLADAVKRNPLWLGGYLFLATIYRETEEWEEAIITLQAGVNTCRIGLGYLRKQSCTPATREMANPILRSRILYHITVLTRYEDMLRHQLGLSLVEAGRFEEALLWWSDPGGEHYA